MYWGYELCWDPYTNQNNEKICLRQPEKFLHRLLHDIGNYCHLLKGNVVNNIIVSLHGDR